MSEDALARLWKFRAQYAKIWHHLSKKGVSMPEEKEALARIQINRLLEESSWRFKDSPE